MEGYRLGDADESQSIARKGRLSPYTQRTDQVFQWDLGPVGRGQKIKLLECNIIGRSSFSNFNAGR